MFLNPDNLTFGSVELPFVLCHRGTEPDLRPSKDFHLCCRAPCHGLAVTDVEAIRQLAACMRATSHAVEPAGRAHKRTGQGAPSNKRHARCTPHSISVFK